MIKNSAQLRDIAYKTLLELSSDGTIYASGRNEAYGCLFGRDSAITILKILNTQKSSKDDQLLAICKKTLLSLVSLQGKEFNLESGEEPGKFIHEYRPDNYERLLQLEKPWYVYPEGALKNYDSIDSTPLTLIAIYRYYQATQDQQFLLSVLPAVERGLNWIITFGDKDKDLLLEYELPKDRKHGGLPVQSWTDSHESLMTKEGKMPNYPIAPIEVQAVAWLALRLWADFYTNEYSEFHNDSFGQKLLQQAKDMKTNFNKAFIIKDQGLYYGAQALDGDKNQIKTITINPLVCLWAAYENDSSVECIVEDRYIEDFVKRAFMPDLFIPHAGIRTMSVLSETFNPGQDSYHNGSIWPMPNGLVEEGLRKFRFSDYARKLKEASIKPFEFFGSAIELFIEKDGSYLPFDNGQGQISCYDQAWSAATLLDFVSE